MANYSYASLLVAVSGDTRQLANDIRDGASKAGADAAGQTSGAFNSGLRAVGGLGKDVGKAVATGLTVATGAATAFGVEAFKSAARVGEMNATLKALANANNLSYESLQKTVGAVKARGIETGVAQGLVAQFVRSELDLTKATDLATVAQDAAVISGKNSSDVLDQLVHGITTQNTMVLRNAGVTVNATKAQDDYAKQLGKSRSELTEAEKSQAVLNAVLVEGEKTSGAYAAAMKEPGKVLRSFKSVTDDIKVSVGEGLVRAFGPLILQAYDLTKAFREAVGPGGALSPIFDAIGVAVGKLIAPLVGLVEQWTKWVANLKPEQLNGVVEIIKKFGPAGIAAAAGISALVAPQLFSQIPILGGLLTNLMAPLSKVGTLVGGLTKSLLVASPALTSSGGAVSVFGLALNPVGLAIAAVVAAIGAMLIASSDFREGVIAMGKALLTGLQPALSSVWNLVKTFGMSLWEIIKAIGDALGPALKNLAPLLEQLGLLFGVNLAGGADGASDSMNGLVPVITGAIRVIGFLLDVTTKVLVPLIEIPLKIMVWISTMLQAVHPLKLLGQGIEWLTGVVKTLWHWITGGSPGLIPAFQLLSSVAGAVAGVLTGPIAGAFSTVAGVVKTAHGAISGAVEETWPKIRGVIQGAMSEIQGAVSSGFNSMIGVARSAGSSMIDGLKGGLSAARGMGGWIGSNVTGPVMGAIKGGLGVGSPSYITIQMGGDVVEGLKQGLDAARNLGGWIQSNVTGPVMGWIKGGLGIGSPSSITITFGQEIINGLQQGMEKARELGGWVMSNVVNPILGTLKSAFGIGSPSRVMRSIGEDIVDGLELGLDGAENVVADAFGGAPSIGSPLAGPAAGLSGLGGGAGATINVYPQAQQDPAQIAAQVSRELAWAAAGGIA